MTSLDRRALARLITSIEAGEPVAGPKAESTARRIGITGPPGAGKSTLVNGLIGELRSRGQTVGVLAVDPSSPITGGALLGDRIRMQGHIDDEGVFVRSMASRGHLGGLAATASEVLDLMASSGFDVVLVETVGVGQSEVEVMDLVDKVAVVLAPGWGDQIQAEKAGIVEIADIVVINKGDLPGVEGLERSLRQALGDTAKVQVTMATTGEGIADLVDALLSVE
jgi:LAO/AO transport system ATPase